MGRAAGPETRSRRPALAGWLSMLRVIAGKHAHGVRMPRRRMNQVDRSNMLRIISLLKFGLAALTALMAGGLAATSGSSVAASPEEREQALMAIPFDRLTPVATNTIREIVDRPTIYRRLPSEMIDCDPKMFLFLVRNPEVLVGIWDRMEVSQVQTQRIGPYQLTADDNAGTKCTIDLVYGDSKTHVYVGKGMYTGPMAPRPITGSGVFILRSEYVQTADGTTVQGTLDCFLKFDNLGADLLARTLSGIIGKTADHNFSETAKFLSQISNASVRDPARMRDLALELPQVNQPTRKAFADTIIDVAARNRSLLSKRSDRELPFIARGNDTQTRAK